MIKSVHVHTTINMCELYTLREFEQNKKNWRLKSTICPPASPIWISLRMAKDHEVLVCLVFWIWEVIRGLKVSPFRVNKRIKQETKSRVCVVFMRRSMVCGCVGEWGGDSLVWHARQRESIKFGNALKVFTAQIDTDIRRYPISGNWLCTLNNIVWFIFTSNECFLYNSTLIFTPNSTFRSIKTHTILLWYDIHVINTIINNRYEESLCWCCEWD
jgi:hypothetical protein